MERYRDRLVCGVEELDRGLDALAERLRPRLAEGEWTAVAVLRGAVFFAADLLRRLPSELRIDFLRVQTYGDGTAPSRAPQVDWNPGAEDIQGRSVLLLDDILDTGRTLREAERFLREELGAAEVLSAVLVDKPARRAVDYRADDHVLQLEEDLFLVGYGLDYAGHFRNLPELRALELGPDGQPLPAQGAQR